MPGVEVKQGPVMADGTLLKLVGAAGFEPATSCV